MNVACCSHRPLEQHGSEIGGDLDMADHGRHIGADVFAVADVLGSDVQGEKLGRIGDRRWGGCSVHRAVSRAAGCGDEETLAKGANNV